MTSAKQPGDEKQAVGARNVRGPSYPAMSIVDALGRARQFWDAEKRNAAPVAAAARHWGYSEKSSSVRTTVAALISYGLVSDTGNNDSRALKLTDRALDILLDEQDSPRRLKAVQEAVQSPKIIAEILAKWPAGEDLPSDQTLRFYLVREKGFNDTSVGDFIQDLRASLAYAKLDKPSTMVVTPSAESLLRSPGDQPRPQAVKIGDSVQWESNGVVQFDSRRVIGLSQDGAYAFVEGSATGLPLQEIKVTQPAAHVTHIQPSPPPAFTPTPAAQVVIGTKQDTFTLDEGPVVLQWPSQLSETSYEDFKDWIELQLRKIKRSIQ